VTLSPAEHSWLHEGSYKRSGWARFAAWVLPYAEHLNRIFSKVPNVAVFDTAAFPWVDGVEREWQTIRAELESVLTRKDELPGLQEIFPDAASVTRERDWKTFVLTGMGVTSQNVRACPQTWRVLQGIPGLSMAMFSIFEPGKRLPPHRGPYNGVLRFHLGLIVPAGDVAIRVGSQVCRWAEGSALIFDDSYEHEAWNLSDGLRVVLFVDFVRPLRFPVNLLNAFLLKLASIAVFVREAQHNQRRWELDFYGQ
jgi:beta-hydroxylase